MAILTSLTVNDTGFVTLPSGTLTQRNTGITTSASSIRYNTEAGSNEYYDGTSWISVSSAAPAVIPNGLVLYWDASVTTSYPGTGNTWYDLSGNGNNGVMVNSPTFSTANGGVIVLNGSNQFVYNTDEHLNYASKNYTVMGAAKYVAVSGRIFTSYLNNWLMGHWGGTTQNYYAEGWVSSAGAGPGDTNWRIYAATGNISADSYSLYVNGTLNVGPSSAGSAGPNGISVGALGNSGAASEYSNAHVGNCLVYNRVLTAAEILYNYNVLKSRFDL